MTKKVADRVEFDSAVEFAKKKKDVFLIQAAEDLRDAQLKQVARAEAVFGELDLVSFDTKKQPKTLEDLEDLHNRLNSAIRENLDADSIYQFVLLCSVRIDANRLTHRGRKNAEIRHSNSGGSRDKRAQIIAAWASGKYSSRDICAEQECAGLNMSFSVARKALIGTPKPA